MWRAVALLGAIAGVAIGGARCLAGRGGTPLASAPPRPSSSMAGLDLVRSSWGSKGTVASASSVSRGPHCEPATTPHRYQNEIFFAPFDEEDPWVVLDKALDDWKGGSHLAVAVGFTIPFGDAGLDRLLRHPKVAVVTHLSLQRSYITPDGLKTLLASPIAPRLVALDLRDALLGVEGARVLAATNRLGALRELNIGRNYLHSEGAQELAGASGLRGLERLELGYNLIGAEGAAALLASPAFPRLRHLGLAYELIGDREFIRRAEPSPLERLECLDLQYNEIGVSAAKDIARSSALPAHAFAFLSGNLSEEMEAKLEGLPHLVFKEGPELDGQVSGFWGGAKPKGVATMTPPAPPPLTLPATVEFRELWIWEFGLVAEHPTFMTPGELPGNGKSRDFTWLDQAGFFAGGHWNSLQLPPDQAFASELADAARPAPGDCLRIEPLGKHAALVWRRGPVKSSVTRVQGTDALLELRFFYPTQRERYFRPIAERCVRSLSFEAGETVTP